jgi:hypothetical protein
MTRKQLIKLLADLLFAYVNKDEDVPHSFEVEAVTKACEFLLGEKTEYGEWFYRMRIDLPLCDFKNCRYFFDHNCTAKNGIKDRCEYRQLMDAHKALHKALTGKEWQG